VHSGGSRAAGRPVPARQPRGRWRRCVAAAAVAAVGARGVPPPPAARLPLRWRLPLCPRRRRRCGRRGHRSGCWRIRLVVAGGDGRANGDGHEPAAAEAGKPGEPGVRGGAAKARRSGATPLFSNPHVISKVAWLTHQCRTERLRQRGAGPRRAACFRRWLLDTFGGASHGP
jgi:hypothetical protein